MDQFTEEIAKRFFDGLAKGLGHQEEQAPGLLTATDWMLVAPAARLCNIPRRTVRRWLEAGKLETKKDNGRTLVNVTQLRAFR